MRKITVLLMAFTLSFTLSLAGAFADEELIGEPTSSEGLLGGTASSDGLLGGPTSAEGLLGGPTSSEDLVGGPTSAIGVAAAPALSTGPLSATAFSDDLSFTPLLIALAHGDQEILISSVDDPSMLTLKEIKSALGNTKLKLKSELVQFKTGNAAIQLQFNVDSTIKLDGIEVFRSLSKYPEKSKSSIFKTENSSYVNTKVSMGKTYYYRIRGFVEVNGKKYYTDFSNRAYRKVRGIPNTEYHKPMPLYVENLSTPDMPISGGFTEAADQTITPELQEIFDKAFESEPLLGVSYKVKQLVATQVVSGINYKFLCDATVVYPGATPTEKYVIINKDLSGNCKVVRVEDVE